MVKLYIKSMEVCKNHQCSELYFSPGQLFLPLPEFAFKAAYGLGKKISQIIHLRLIVMQIVQFLLLIKGPKYL